MKLIFSFLFYFVAGSFGWATNKVGNGGNIVSCAQGKSVSYQLLDFYEANLEDKQIKKSNVDIVKSEITKLKSVAPELYDQYEKRLKTILSEFDYKDNVQLIDVKDSLHAFTPKSKNCKVIQTIIRKDQVTQNEKRFLVDQAIWSQLNSYQQAGLILHEMIYEHFSKLGEKDSVKARKLNAYIFKNDVIKKEFWLFMTELDIPIYQ